MRTGEKLNKSAQALTAVHLVGNVAYLVKGNHTFNVRDFDDIKQALPWAKSFAEYLGIPCHDLNTDIVHQN
jgi:hypothetical protein